jgi:hypothetical protein
MHGDRHAQRQLQRAQSKEEGGAFIGGAGWRGVGVVHVHGNGDGAGHGASSSASSTGPSSLGRRVVQALDQRAVHVQRDLVDLAQLARARAPRGRFCAPSTGSTSGSVSARTRSCRRGLP